MFGVCIRVNDVWDVMDDVWEVFVIGPARVPSQLLFLKSLEDQSNCEPALADPEGASEIEADASENF